MGKRLHPFAETVPFGKLVVSSGIVDVDKILIVECAGAGLIVGGGKKLDHIVPIGSFLCLNEFETGILKHTYNRVETGKCALAHSVAGEIFAAEGLGVDLVHGACGVGNCADLICIILLPPIEGSCNVN